MYRILLVLLILLPLDDDWRCRCCWKGDDHGDNEGNRRTTEDEPMSSTTATVTDAIIKTESSAAAVAPILVSFSARLVVCPREGRSSSSLAAAISTKGVDCERVDRGH
jgi:hypothetical protein